MYSWKRLLIGFSLLFIAIFTAKFLYEELSSDFQITHIQHDFPQEPSWELPPLNDQERLSLREVLNQPYEWLGQGHQIFAFVSQDQKYVLKIFKFKRLKPSATANYLSTLPFLSHYYKQQENRRLRRIDKLFKGYKIAYLIDQDNTRLQYLHLNNRSTDLKQTVTLTDRLGLTHHVDMDTTVFAIQDRGIKTKDVLKSLLEKGDVAGVNKHIDALFALFMNEYAKGVVDMDHNVLENTGFVRETAIRIDVGQLNYDPTIEQPEAYKKDLTKIATKRLYSWIERKYPQYLLEISKHMEERLSELFGEPFSFHDKKFS